MTEHVPNQNLVPQPHIKYMPKKDGYVAASDIPTDLGVVTKILEVHSQLPDIPNRVALKVEAFSNELLILTKGDATQLGKEIGSFESEEWIKEWVKIEVVARKFGKQAVYGMKVTLYHGHVADMNGLVRGPRVANAKPS